jgi:hypothetical protein
MYLPTTPTIRSTNKKARIKNCRGTTCQPLTKAIKHMLHYEVLKVRAVKFRQQIAKRWRQWDWTTWTTTKEISEISISN